jgi:hypothetical protein
MPNHRTDHDHYVTKINWLVATGRDDLIDEIADEYERPACSQCASPPERRAS